MKIFSENILQARKDRAAEALQKTLGPHDILVFFSGEPVQKPGGLDQTYPFLPHPDYYWLTGFRRSGGVSTFSKSEGWVDFIKPISDEEKIWEGAGDQTFTEQNISELESWLVKRKSKRIFQLGQPTAKQLALYPIPDENFKIEIQECFNAVRRVKDSAEVQLVRNCADMANAGYKKIREFIRPGVTERQIQIEFETAVLKAGSEKFPYDSIVGSGVNAAVLHAIPTAKVVKSGEIILVDAGADVHDYCVDITRDFSADGKFTSRQKDIYDLVMKAQLKGIEMCKPGTEWSDVHLSAARIMADGLKSLKVLKCDADTAVETGAIAVFFPHGVGHMVGLKVRDVGGLLNQKVRQYAGSRLRVDFQLQKHFLMTVEPGLYFIKALIDKSENREKYQDQINWSEVEKWRDFGGIRIEDDILVDNTPQNLTAVVDK